MTDANADARTIARSFINDLRDSSVMDWAEVLDAHLTQDDIVELSDAIKAVADRLEAALKETD